jgi:hypothetical protein
MPVIACPFFVVGVLPMLEIQGENMAAKPHSIQACIVHT